MSVSKSEIKKFYQNQTIFVTGGTGFVGKIILEKLMRECDDFVRIYLLARPKKNKTAEQRFLELFELPCFERVRDKKETLEKVILVNGDCLQPFLGLSEQNLVILKSEVSCVIHAAANVKFDQTLKDASKYVKATGDMLDLAKQMRNLKAFVFISTAYSNCLQTEIKENFYEPPMKPEDFLSFVNSVSDDTLKKITPLVLDKWPNCYIFGKAISEAVIKSASNYLPLTVVRPAIVINSIAEPIPGWIDNIYGPVGVLAAAGLGILNSIHAKGDAVAAYVPVDYVANCVLAAASKTTRNDTVIYNYAGTRNNTLTYNEFRDCVTECGWSTPPENLLWYYNLAIRNNFLWYKICVFLYQTIPAYSIDFVLLCMRKPAIAVKLYDRLGKAMKALVFFGTRTFYFHDENTIRLWNELSDEDKSLFNFNMEKIDWKECLKLMVKGMKLYIYKDPLVPTPRAWRKLYMLFVVYYLFKALRWYLLYKFIMYIWSLVF